MIQPEHEPTPALGNRGLAIAECIPEDLAFLDDYQTNAVAQIQFDGPGSRTIRGKQLHGYMYDGLVEELGELFEADKLEPGYSRLGAVMLLDGSEDLSQTPKLEPGEVTPTSIARHLKEFGDVSWYLANYLHLYGLKFSRTAPVGVAAWELERISSPRATGEFSLWTERALPWTRLVEASNDLQIAAEAILGMRRDERIQQEKQLLIAAGKTVTSMMQFVQTRFGITYEAILDTNHAKIEKRTQDGTVLDKSGGDDR